MSLPIALRLEGISVLIAGCGKGTARALFALVEAGARVTLVASGELPKEVELLASQGEIRRLRAPLKKSDLQRYRLVFAAGPGRAANRRILAWARAAKVWAGSLEAGGEGEVALLNSVRRSGLTVAFADAKARPGLTAFLRRRLQRALPRWLKQAPKARPKLKRRLIRGWASVARNPD
ncbi:MAG: hypothetical protein IT572_10345 [Deltaproteobacteria bacterium]|nr:hypothetical protein [Deltaproteobacteria bacterium]